MEAAVYTAVRSDNRELLERLEEYVALIGRTQQPDGYISTKQIIGERNGKAARLGDINDFEVYNFGHLFTSACLYKRLTGKDSFLTIARKAAGYLKICMTGRRKAGRYRPQSALLIIWGWRSCTVPQVIRDYLELPEKAGPVTPQGFRKGRGADDNQDRLPLKEHDRGIGHAVRANYLYAGVADLCLEEEEPELAEVLHKVWNSLVTQKCILPEAAERCITVPPLRQFFLPTSSSIRPTAMNISFPM